VGGVINADEEPSFFACRVLATKPDRRDYVIFPGKALARRRDVEVASKGFATEEAATAEIKRLRGSIPDGFDLFLDFWDEDGKTVWCLKDCSTSSSNPMMEDAMGRRRGYCIPSSLM
jgi:hypothetical protein